MHLSIVLAMMICGMPLTAQVNKALLDKKITIASKTTRMDSLLKVFARQTGAGYSFNARSISAAQTITVPAHSQKLSQWLETLRIQMGITYKITGNHIILFENRKPLKPGSNKTKTVVAQEHKPVTGRRSEKAPVAIPPAIPVSSVDTTDTPIVARKVVKDTAAPAQKAIKATPAMPAKRPREAQQATDATKATPAMPSRDSNEDPQEYMQFFLGYARHGSGDYEGVSFGGDYTRYLSRPFSLSVDLRGSINSGKTELYYIHQPSGERTDASVRFTTAGVQFGINAQYSFVKSLHHEAMVSLGGFGRYQSASNGSDGFSTYEEQVTGLPLVLVGYDNITPQHTFAAGGLLQLHYHFTFGNHLLLGIRGGFQTDTNGDLLVQAGISVGKRF